MTTNTFVYVVADEHITDDGTSFRIICPTCFKLLAEEGDNLRNFYYHDYSGKKAFFHWSENNCDHITSNPYGKEILCASLMDYNDPHQSPCFEEVSADCVPMYDDVSDANVQRRVFKVGVLDILSIGQTDQGYISYNKYSIEDLIDNGIVFEDLITHHTHTRIKEDPVFHVSETIFLIKTDRYNELTASRSFTDNRFDNRVCEYFEARCRCCGKEHLNETAYDN